MKIKISRKNKELPLPEYKTHGSVAFDFAAAEDIVIQSREIAYIPTGLIIKVPEGYALIISARSSTAKKYGLMLTNSIGIIDQDYCGPEDEIKVSVYNFTDKLVEIKRGDRIAQGMFVKIDKVEWQETNELSASTRGGFGSTG